MPERHRQKTDQYSNGLMHKMIKDIKHRGKNTRIINIKKQSDISHPKELPLKK